jgi:isoamylase
VHRSLLWCSLCVFVSACAGATGPVEEGDEKSDDATAPRARAVGASHPGSGAYAPVNRSGWASATWPQGAHFSDGEGSNLRVGVYSARASRVLLEVYGSATGASARHDYWMTRGPDNVWRAELQDVPGKTLYAFRAWGPNWPHDPAWRRGGSSAGFVSDVDAEGNRFNPNKVLFDPYARELSHDKSTPALVARGLDGKMYGTGGALYHGVPRRVFDTGPWAPKSVALVDETDTGARPAVEMRDSIIYEAHVRGLSAHPSAMSLATLLSGVNGFERVVNVPEACRGTYRAAGLMAPYLQGLGVNVIELLPVHEFSNETNSQDTAKGNFWGYVTDGFFAPDRHYACDRSLGGPTAEFKEMVRAFHEHGIEVWLDVVYNHTGEGGSWDQARDVAELTSLRGLDNVEFYMLVDGDRGSFWETTGVGNNLNVTTEASRRLVLDSLRYWADEMGVDGFRFDLATVLGRDAAPRYEFNPRARLLLDIEALGRERGVDVIAEAWDIAAYNVGQFPAGWGEWNGRYRDASRRFLRGDVSGAPGVSYADAFYGDVAGYEDQGGPSRSINFIVAHDGFTLADLVSYGAKTNASRLWPFGPSDGGNDSNDSWDSGGDKALRRQRLRNFIVWQMFGRGVPMIVAGDELARTQNGNNNPYNVDAVVNWNNYAMIASDAPQRAPTGTGGEAYHDNLGEDTRPDGRSFAFDFMRRVIALRRSSEALRQEDYRMPIHFAKSDGRSGFDSRLDRAARIHLDGSAAGDADWLLFVNMWTGVVDFAAPQADPGQRWVRIIDTAAWAEPAGNVWLEDAATELAGAYGVQPWSIAVFKAVDAQTTVPVTFRCDGCTTVVGQDVYVAGDAAALGAWSPELAVKLAPTAYPTWTATVALPAGRAVAYKLIKRSGAQVIWEGGENRIYQVPASGPGETGGTWR